MLSLIWMLVLRLFCGVMVWVTIWMANLCFIACTIFSYAKAGDVSTTSKLGHVSHAMRLPSRVQGAKPSNVQTVLLYVELSCIAAAFWA